MFDIGGNSSGGSANSSGEDNNSSSGNIFYNDDDRMWNLSRIFLYVGLTCGGLTVIWSWSLSTCVVPTSVKWRLLSILAAVTAVLQVPIFLILESDVCNYDTDRQQCTLGTGAFLNIASIGLWIMLTLVIQCLRPPRWDIDDQFGAWRTVTHIRPSYNKGGDGGGAGTTTAAGGGGAAGAASNGCPTDGTSTEGGGDGMMMMLPPYSPSNTLEMSSPSSSSRGDVEASAPWPIISSRRSREEDQDQEDEQNEAYLDRIDVDVEKGHIVEDMEVYDDGRNYSNNGQRQQQQQLPPKQVLRSTSLLDENANNDNDGEGDVNGGLGDGFGVGDAAGGGSSSSTSGGDEVSNEDDEGMSTTDRVIFDGVNLCHGFRIEMTTGRGDDRDSVKNDKKKNHHHPSSASAMKSRSSSNHAVGGYHSSSGGRSGGSSTSNSNNGDGVKVTCVYSDGTRYETRLPSCMVDMTGKIQSLCSIDENNSINSRGQVDNGHGGVGNGGSGENGNGLLGTAAACVGQEEDETMNVDYLTRRMRSDVAAAVAAAEDGIFGSMDDDGAPIETIEIDMSSRVKSTIGLTGIDDNGGGEDDDDENNGRRRSTVYQNDDVSELTKGSGLVSSVSDILDSGTQQGTMSILEDLARTY